MAGSLLETMSNAKLGALFVCSVLAVVATALLGGFVAPDPMGYQTNLMRFCDSGLVKDKSDPIDASTCARGELRSLADAKQMSPSNLVMWTQFPHANSGLSMSKWFQFIASSLIVELDDDAEHQYHPGAVLSFEATLAYKNKMNDSEWTVMVESLQEWEFQCTRKSHSWVCDQINFFELGSCHHAAYLINLRLPTYKGKNKLIGTLSDIWITEIHQNGGFTKIMLSIRTVFFQLAVVLFTFYLRRVYKSDSPVTLLQKAVGTLGFSLVLLNAPVEVVSLFKDVPGLLIWSDIRQGVFYAFLVLFLVVFMGEHSADDKGRNSWKSYKYPIFFTAFTSGALLIFDLQERGRQLWDPFHSVWANKDSRFWGMLFISSAVFALALDIIYLIYLTYVAISSLRKKLFTMPNLTASRRNHYKSALQRVLGVFFSTILVGVMTVTLFAIMQYSEVNLKWDEVKSVNMNSGSYLAIYALANVYALNLLLLYSPAKKPSDDVTEEKQTLISNGPTVLQLAAKANQD